MADMYDVDGNKIEGAVTKEEHEAQVAATTAKAIEDATKSGLVVPKADLDKLSTDLETAKEALKKFEGKDMNFEKLREGKEAAEKLVKDLTDKVDSLGKKVGEVDNKVSGTDVDSAIAQLADGDKEMEKKIRFHFDRISKVEDTVEQKKQKLIDAATLAQGSRPAPVLTAGILSARGSYSPQDMHDKAATGPLSAEAAELAKKFNLSDKDIAKYGQK